MPIWSLAPIEVLVVMMLFYRSAEAFFLYYIMTMPLALCLWLIPIDSVTLAVKHKWKSWKCMRVPSSLGRSLFDFKECGYKSKSTLKRDHPAWDGMIPISDAVGRRPNFLIYFLHVASEGPGWADVGVEAQGASCGCGGFFTYCRLHFWRNQWDRNLCYFFSRKKHDWRPVQRCTS